VEEGWKRGANGKMARRVLGFSQSLAEGERKCSWEELNDGVGIVGEELGKEMKHFAEQMHVVSPQCTRRFGYVQGWHARNPIREGNLKGRRASTTRRRGRSLQRSSGFSRTI
jgi:hypothetical protein